MTTLRKAFLTAALCLGTTTAVLAADLQTPAPATPPSSYATPPAFSDLRHDHPAIDEAIAAMPSHEITGTLNRLSELLRRKSVRELSPGAGERNELPKNFTKGLDAALEDLLEDVGKENLEPLDSTQAMYVLLVVRKYAFDRPVELYEGNTFDYCNPCPLGEECPPCSPDDDDPSTFDQLDEIVSVVRGTYGRIIKDQAPGFEPSASRLNGNNFVGAVRELATRVSGVESIDG